MREQFPKAIENRRKSLYPEMRKARQNKQNKVRLIKDKLYINNIQYIPEDIEGDSENDQIQNPNAKVRQNYQSRDFPNRNYQNHQRPRSWETPRDFPRGRTFKRSANRGRYNNGWAPRKPFVGKAVNFASPNMYAHLPRDDDLMNMTGKIKHLPH